MEEEVILDRKDRICLQSLIAPHLLPEIADIIVQYVAPCRDIDMRYGEEDTNDVCNEDLWEYLLAKQEKAGKPEKFKYILDYYSEVPITEVANSDEWEDITGLDTKDNDIIQATETFCICSQKIQQLIFIESKYNGNVLRVGNCCIKKFMSDHTKQDHKIKDNQRRYERQGGGNRRQCATCFKRRLGTSYHVDATVCGECKAEGKSAPPDTIPLYNGKECAQCKKRVLKADDLRTLCYTCNEKSRPPGSICIRCHITKFTDGPICTDCVRKEADNKRREAECKAAETRCNGCGGQKDRRMPLCIGCGMKEWKEKNANRCKNCEVKIPKEHILCLLCRIEEENKPKICVSCKAQHRDGSPLCIPCQDRKLREIMRSIPLTIIRESAGFCAPKMNNAQRTCVECKADISGQPPHQSKCYPCFRKIYNREADEKYTKICMGCKRSFITNKAHYKWCSNCYIPG